MPHQNPEARLIERPVPRWTAEPGPGATRRRHWRAKLRCCAALVMCWFAMPAVGLVPHTHQMPEANSELVAYPPDEPADGRWLEDEDGEYFVARVDRKGEGMLFRRRGDVLRFRLGLTARVVGEDDESIHVRVRKSVRNSKASSSGTDVESKPAPPKPEPVRAVEPQLARESVSLSVADVGRGLPESGMWRNGADIVDFNDDGRLDIVAPPARKGAPVVSVFFNLGGGQWTTRVVSGYEGGALDYGDVRLRDFDGDGRKDIALAMHLMGTTVAYQIEPGRWVERSEGFDRPDFANPNSRFGKRAPWSSRVFETLDVDGDGDLDLVAVGEGADSLTVLREARDQGPVWSEGITVYRNNGSEAWDSFRFQDLPFGGHTIDVGQLDDDPAMEFVVAWLNSHDSRLILDIEPTESGFTATLQNLDSLGLRPGAITVAEAHDVRPGSATDEILVGRLFRADDGLHTHVELHERVDGTWTRELIAELRAEERVVSLTAGDVDADGITDIVAGTGRDTIFVFHGQSDGTFLQQTARLNEDPNTTCQAFWVRLVDLDGEPGDELVAGFAGETTQIPIVGREAPGCRGQGSIEAWSFERIAGGEASQD